MDRRDVMDVLLRLRRYAENGRDDVMEAKDLVALGTILTNMSQHFMSRAQQQLDASTTGAVLTAEIEEARQELDEARRSTEEAADDILSSAERLMGLNACPPEVSEEAMRIMTACSFQDLAGQRMSKVSDVLVRMEKREGVGETADVTNILPLGLHPTDDLAQGPVPDGDGLDQSAIDRMLEAV